MGAALPVTILYIDVTHTLVSGLATGIQRVVRKVVAELLRQSVPGIRRVCPVVALDKTFLLLDEAAIDQLLHPATVAGHARSPGMAVRLIAKAGAYLPALMDVMQNRRFRRMAERVIDRPLNRAEIGDSDIVLLLDAFWGGSGALVAAHGSRERGATIVATAYDLIPATHPRYMTPVSAKLFVRRLGEAIDLCDGFVAISQATATGLAGFAQPRRIRTEVAYCGADVGPPLPHLDIQADGHSYISVGTLEPRKGHDLILDAFERLWAGGSHARLTFVGRRGWGVDALWQRCRDLMDQGMPFRLIDDADDTMLAHLLAQSSAAIVASEVEGFGLPVVEALGCDLPVIASDIPVFREIASGAVSFFDPANAAALAGSILAFERDPAPMRAAARRFTWPTWQEAAPGYAQAALRIQGQARADRKADRD